MKSFLIKIAAAFGVLTVLNLYLSHFVTHDLIFEDYLDSKDQIYQSHAPILLLGDSHGMKLKQEDLGDSVLNLSYHRDSYSDMYIKLVHCIANDFIPRKVIIPVDYHCFTSYRYWSNNKRPIIFYDSYDTYSQVYNTTPLKYAYQKLSLRLPMLDASNSELLEKHYSAAWKRTRKKVNLLMKGKDLSKYNWSGKWVPPLWIEYSDEERVIKNEDRVKGQFPDQFNPLMVRRFDLIRDVCKEYEIELVAIRFPVTRMYYDEIMKKPFGKTDSVVACSDIPVLDYHDLYFDRDSLFLDQDHLLDTVGGKMFTRVFLDTIFE